MMVIAYFFIVGFIYLYAPKLKVDREKAIDISIVCFIGGIIGSRIVFILMNLEQYSGHWTSILDFQKGGLSWHGGVLGGILAIVVTSKLKGISIPKMLDLIMTPAIAGLGIGRIGCFLNGCCYGKACSLPWAVTFPHHRLPIPVHPTQIYEMILDFTLFAFLIYWWNRKKFDGELAMLMMAIYSIIRFFVESFRYNTPNQMILGLSLAQWVSLLIFIILMPTILILRKNARPINEAITESEKEKDKIKSTEETGQLSEDSGRS